MIPANDGVQKLVGIAGKATSLLDSIHADERQEIQKKTWN
jgi:hypothetical protein